MSIQSAGLFSHLTDFKNQVSNRLSKVFSNFHVTERFTFDLRSLAAFRIAISSLILVDLTIRAQDLRAHYTDFGVLPRGVQLENFVHDWLVSFQFVSGRKPIQKTNLQGVSNCAHRNDACR